MLKLPSEILKMLQIPKNKLNECIEPFFLGQLMEQHHFIHLKVAAFPRSCDLHPKTFFLIDSKES